MESLNSRSVLPPDPPLIGQTGVINGCFGVFALYLLRLCFYSFRNVLRGIGKAYVENLNSRSVLSPDPLYGSNWGHKIANFEFLPLSPLLLLLYLQNVLRGIEKEYVESLNSRSVLPPDPPPPHIGQTGVINSCFGVFALYLLCLCCYSFRIY